MQAEVVAQQAEEYASKHTIAGALAGCYAETRLAC